MIPMRGGSTCCAGPGGHTPAWFKVFQNGSFVATGKLRGLADAAPAALASSIAIPGAPVAVFPRSVCDPQPALRPTVTNSPPSCPSVRIQPSCASQPSRSQLSSAPEKRSSDSVARSALG